jgi:hypothetical protein
LTEEVDSNSHYLPAFYEYLAKASGLHKDCGACEHEAVVTSVTAISANSLVGCTDAERGTFMNALVHACPAWGMFDTMLDAIKTYPDNVTIAWNFLRFCVREATCLTQAEAAALLAAHVPLILGAATRHASSDEAIARVDMSMFVALCA